MQIVASRYNICRARKTDQKGCDAVVRLNLKNQSEAHIFFY